MALECTSALQRQEYHVLLRSSNRYPTLARCCLAPRLGLVRYRQCQQYNVSFGKKEAVIDLDRLLSLPSRWSFWNPENVQAFLGLVCLPSTAATPDTKEDPQVTQSFSVVFKDVAMSSSPPSLTANKTKPGEASIHRIDLLEYRDDSWVFGDEMDSYPTPKDGDTSHPMCLSGDRIKALLWDGKS